MKPFVFLLLLASLSGCHHSAPSDPLVAIQIQDRNGLTETVSTPDRLETFESVDFLHSQPYKKVLRVYRGEGKNRSKITTYHPNGSIWQYLEAQEMRAFGAYREWYPNGQIKIEAAVIGGTADVAPGSQQDWLFDGLCQVWDEQGRILAKIPYSKGFLEGTSTYFYPSGQIEKEIPYSKNAIEGEVHEFLSDGKLKCQSRYKKGLKEGATLIYFPNLQLAAIEEYTEGLLRTASYYKPNGELLSEIENGGGFQAHFDGEILSSTVEFRCGRPEGRVQKYTPSGDLIGLYHLKNGKKQGEEIEFFLAGETEKGANQPQPKLSIAWNENTIHGSVKTWYNTGQLHSQREFCRNQKMGPSVAWYRNGSLMFIEEYEADQLTKGKYYKISQRDPVSSILNGNGIASLYDDEGVFLRKITYIKGKAVDPEE